MRGHLNMIILTVGRFPTSRPPDIPTSSPVYSTCLFCTRPLGANEVLEHFPVGRRIAFDAAKGRLWVVCRRCARWNLTPLEERWEAIEEAERLFRDTRLRVSTDNIGLAKLSEGLELVRVGKPQRPEIAAWRYGNQFARRRIRGLAAASVVAVGGAALMGGLAVGVGAFATMGLSKGIWQLVEYGLPWQTIARIQKPHWPLMEVQRRHLRSSAIVVGSDSSLALMVDHTGGRVQLEGAEARRAATRIFPAITRFGGTTEEVRSAVERLNSAGDAERYLSEATRMGARLTRARTDGKGAADPDTGLLALPTTLSLALEMALHEEQERRALEGELAELEAAWRDAEEIGAIADSLLMPEWVEEAIRRMRRA
jgi:uncharacterized membrane protein YgdD (TMEM256/DUF423 family)